MIIRRRLWQDLYLGSTMSHMYNYLCDINFDGNMQDSIKIVVDDKNYKIDVINFEKLDEHYKSKFLTKQQIIDKLKILPDLPVVFECGTDVISNNCISSIEILPGRLNWHSNMEHMREYDTYNPESKNYEDYQIEQIIYIK